MELPTQSTQAQAEVARFRPSSSKVPIRGRISSIYILRLWIISHSISNRLSLLHSSVRSLPTNDKHHLTSIRFVRSALLSFRTLITRFRSWTLGLLPPSHLRSYRRHSEDSYHPYTSTTSKTTRENITAERPQRPQSNVTSIIFLIASTITTKSTTSHCPNGQEMYASPKLRSARHDILLTDILRRALRYRSGRWVLRDAAAYL